MGKMKGKMKVQGEDGKDFSEQRSAVALGCMNPCTTLNKNKNAN